MPRPSPPLLMTRTPFALCAAVAAFGATAPSAWAAADDWLRPVPGPVVRPFDYASSRAFAPGAHRGADLDATPGAPVRAACSGRVVHAGGVAALGRVVTVRCGDRRVTYLPLATIAVRSRDVVVRGARLGTVAAGHGGLHLGVRRASDQFAYEDPMAHLSDAAPVTPVLRVPAPRSPTGPAAVRVRPPDVRVASRPHGGVSRLSPPVTVPPPARALGARPAHGSETALQPVPALPVLSRPQRSETAPWPVWLGLAALLTGCVGTGTVALGRRRRAAPAPASAGSA